MTVDGYDIGRDVANLGHAHAEHCADGALHGGGLGEEGVRAIVAAMLLEHDAAPGAHAPAFEAHAMSPGAVEEAEELAGEILDSAAEEISDAVDAIEEASEEAVEIPSEAAEEAVEDVTDVVQIPVEAIEREREPLRVHPLHRRIGRGA